MSLQDSKFTKSLHEPIKLTLQKEIDLALSHYEEERLHELHMDLKIKELETEMEKIQIKKNAEERLELLAKCNSLQKKLEVSQAHVNTTQNENLVIRNKIDHMRIVTANHKLKIKSLEIDIKKSQFLARIKNEEKDKEKTQEKEKLSEIRMAMSKSANAKLRFTQKLEAISSIIKQEKNNNALTLKKLNENLEVILNKELTILDNTKLMKKLCDRFQSEIKKLNFQVAKRKQRNLKLHDLFEAVKANSNLLTPDELVEGFLNFYEESTRLSKYLLEVLAEIESLEFANKKIESNCDESNNLLLTSRSKASRIHFSLSENMKKTYRSINTAIKHQAFIKEQLERIKSWLHNSLSLCEFLQPLHTAVTADGEESLFGTLATLEEQIHSLRIYSLYTERRKFSVKNITLSPTRIRRPTPEITVIFM